MNINWSLWEVPKQKHSSANTSINKTRVPKLFKVIKDKFGWGYLQWNFDIGSGKYIDTIRDYLREQSTQLYYYDPFTIDWEDNRRNLITCATKGGAHTVTVSNVLNVIKEKRNQTRVIQQAHVMLRPGPRITSDGRMVPSTAYFSVYSKQGCGVGEETKPDCWQSNKTIHEYLPEVKKIFGNVAIKYGIIIATK